MTEGHKMQKLNYSKIKSSEFCDLMGEQRKILKISPGCILVFDSNQLSNKTFTYKLNKYPKTYWLMYFLDREILSDKCE